MYKLLSPQRSAGLLCCPGKDVKAPRASVSLPHLRLQPVCRRVERPTAATVDAPVLEKREPVPSSSGDAEPQNENTDDYFTRGPEWLKLAAIAFTSALVGLLELVCCRRPPVLWAPMVFLGGFILWRLSLREVSNSNVPPRAPDRLFMGAVAVLIMFWEYSMTKMMVWAPWMCLVVAVILSPSRRDMDNREHYLAEETRTKVQRAYLDRVPVTPSESAAWVGRLLSCFWGPYFEPMMLQSTILPLQEQVEAAAPRGWTLTLDTFSLGDVAPLLTGWQVYNNTSTGQVERLTADFVLDSTSLTVGITGTGPFVGKFVVNLRGIKLTGKVQLVPLSSSRLMLASFVDNPVLDVKLAVKGRFIGQQSIPQFAFLREAFLSTLNRELVEPNRTIIPLDYAPVAGKPLGSVLTVRVLNIYGLQTVISQEQENALLRKFRKKDSKSEEDGVSIELDDQREEPGDTVDDSLRSQVLRRVPALQAHRVFIRVNVPEMKLTRELAMRTIKPDGTAEVDSYVDMQLSNISAVAEVQLTNERGFGLGEARFRVAHLPDGATAFWGTTEGGRPTATRWTSGSPPWKATLSVQGSKSAFVEVECQMSEWQYSLDTSTPRMFRTGLRSVIAVQVLEAQHLVAADFNGLSDPYIRIMYDKRAATTKTVYRSLSPIYGDVLLFPENRSMLARRLRIDVFDRDRLRSSDPCGHAFINLDLVTEGQISEQWLQLRDVPRGELRVRTYVLSGTDDSLEVRAEAMKELETNSVVYSSDAIKCTVVRLEKLPMQARQKPIAVAITHLDVAQATGRRLPDMDTGDVEFDEDLRFRTDVEDAPKIRVMVFEKGNDLSITGKEVATAVIDPSDIYDEMKKIRLDKQAKGGEEGAHKQPQDRLRSSAARLLLGRRHRVTKADKKQRKGKTEARAAKVKVASLAESKTSAQHRTDTVEFSVPFIGGAPDFRVVLRVQGAVGEHAQLEATPLEMQKLTWQSAEKVTNGWAQLQQGVVNFGRKIASFFLD